MEELHNDSGRSSQLVRLVAGALDAFRRERLSIPGHLIERHGDKLQDDGALGLQHGLFVERWAANPLPAVPWFVEAPNGTLSTPLEPHFPIYLLRNALRGPLVSSRFLVAGDILHERRLFAASTALFYTACYHLATAFLAVHGEVAIAPVHGPPAITTTGNASRANYRDLSKPADLVMLRVTRHGQWNIERRQRNHQRRWKDFGEALIRSGPNTVPGVERLFRYILGTRVAECGSFGEFIRKGVTLVAKRRHDALYGGFGYDHSTFDDLTNRDAFSTKGLDAQVVAFRDCARDLWQTTNRFIDRCKEAVGPEELLAVSGPLLISATSPPFETPELDDLMAHPAMKRVEDIYVEWFLMSRPSKNRGNG